MLQFQGRSGEALTTPFTVFGPLDRYIVCRTYLCKRQPSAVKPGRFIPPCISGRYCDWLRVFVRVCECVCVYVLCMYARARAFVCPYVRVFLGRWVCMHLCVCVCVCVSFCAPICASVCVGGGRGCGGGGGGACVRV